MFGEIFNHAIKRQDIVHNKDEAIEVERDQMEHTLTSLGDYLYQSVYSSIFPPYIAEYTKDTIPDYIRYITEIQKEMKRRIEFVFDDEFYPDELSKFVPRERYSLYAEVYGTPTSFIREERFTMNGNMSLRKLKNGNIPMEDIVQRLTSYTDSSEQSPLEKGLGLKPGRVQIHYHVPRFIQRQHYSRYAGAGVYEDVGVRYSAAQVQELRTVFHHQGKLCCRILRPHKGRTDPHLPADRSAEKV